MKKNFYLICIMLVLVDVDVCIITAELCSVTTPLHHPSSWPRSWYPTTHNVGIYTPPPSPVQLHYLIIHTFWTSSLLVGYNVDIYTIEFT